MLIQTVPTLSTFLLCMMLFPEVQRKAQAEIDAIVGGDRLPRIADRDALPYVGAILKEVLRWRPVVPMGTFRARFPPGSILLT